MGGIGDDVLPSNGTGDALGLEYNCLDECCGADAEIELARGRLTNQEGCWRGQLGQRRAGRCFLHAVVVVVRKV